MRHHCDRFVDALLDFPIGLLFRLIAEPLVPEFVVAVSIGRSLQEIYGSFDRVVDQLPVGIRALAAVVFVASWLFVVVLLVSPRDGNDVERLLGDGHRASQGVIRANSSGGKCDGSSDERLARGLRVFWRF